MQAILPDRDPHTKETIYSNSYKAQNWNKSQQDDHAADEETGREWSLHLSIHHYSQWYCHTTYQKISHSQRDNKAEGCLLNVSTDPKGQNYQHVTQTASNGNEHFHHGINSVFLLHCASSLVGVWRLMVQLHCVQKDYYHHISFRWNIWGSFFSKLLMMLVFFLMFDHTLRFCMF